MKIYILGIGGTLMAGIALLAKQLGHDVSGCDTALYPPMSDQLAAEDIAWHEGFDAETLLKQQPDLTIVGNVVKRGNPAMETILNQRLPYCSGPQWLSQHLLKERWVIAVAGTHGKTSTSSMLAWIMNSALGRSNEQNVGFLIGGIPQNFAHSAALGQPPFFIIEADEYDAAFFDKRSKFIHYQPRSCLLNNLEFDHADIFDNINDIQKQFHHLIRTLPSNGRIISNAADARLNEVLAMDCWTPIDYFNDNSGWWGEPLSDDYRHFAIYRNHRCLGEVKWVLLGEHNMHNAIAAVATAHHAGISPRESMAILTEFEGVKRRLERENFGNDITLYNDFAHHPTAIAKTLTALRRHTPAARIIALVELGSYSMRTAAHGNSVEQALAQHADHAFIKQADDAIEPIINAVSAEVQPGDHVVVMCNRGVNRLSQALRQALKDHVG
ncbi:MAG: UDP-N-acetylmuramate:L-alanyl-gamma-D-glutamyl-meso-diaminopimelate ligase [Gammaproteobacteria bacterium]|nr:UDP-N-acetylmuramate:L-alanyl-gamma-D-glutamyl-meso-diaminopimelate ligase [Gammaproteobacteria bacterium]